MPISSVASAALERAVLSGPPRLFITGPRHVGKSTLVRAVLAQGHGVWGFITLRVASGNARGYDAVLLPKGTRFPYARDTWEEGLRFGQWRFRTDVFEYLLADHLERTKTPDSLLILDELGFAERGCNRFRDAVASSLLTPGPVLGVVQLRALPHWLPVLVRANVPLIYLSTSNRSRWRQIVAALFGRLVARRSAENTDLAVGP